MRLQVDKNGRPAIRCRNVEDRTFSSPRLSRELAIFRGQVKPGKLPPVSGGVMTAVLERFGPAEAGAAKPLLAGLRP